MATYTLEDFMTRTPAFVKADSSLLEVQELFASKSFRHLPVLIESEVVGILSERDVYLAGSLAESSETMRTLSAADICSPDPYTVDISTPLAEVVQTMGERKLGAVIITEFDTLAGILTTTDVCKMCTKLLDAKENS